MAMEKHHYFNEASQTIVDLLTQITSLAEYRGHICLPDLHYKAEMEGPSSVAVSTGKYLIPTLASVAINDGMSIIRLPINRTQLSDEIIEALFAEINMHAATHRLSMTKYSPSIAELRQVCLHGASALLKKYGLSDDLLEAMELGGVLNDDLIDEDVDRLVPKALLNSRFSRAEFGLNFRGNHFLELQSVDQVRLAHKRFDFTPGDLLIMTHLGPGPFTGNLLRLYSNRQKIPNLHRLFYFVAKLYFHFFENFRREFGFESIVKNFFVPDKYQSFHIDTPIGKDFYKLIQIGTNYGYAYQLGTYCAVRDAVKSIQNRFFRGYY